MKNQLIRESSPYLLQHKDNPIAWRAWNAQAFDEAEKLGRPIFLSIGYSTCHWCHVMAHECFEDPDVADFINAHFISIKVDREERPDIDAVYMNVLQTLTGGGGWPLSAWITSKGQAFFAGTYFPKLRFLQILRRISEVWERERPALLQDSDRLMQAVRDGMGEGPNLGTPDPASMREFLKTYINSFQELFDEQNGGFGRAPKFPQTMNLMTMMRQDVHTQLHQAEALVQMTLTHMSRGGIYDHLCGGFHRYSVDEKWLVPHFEKMLYDQALISVTLSDAYQLYGDPEHARVLKETIEYVLNEMRSAQGGFYAAQDADSLDPATGQMHEGFFCTYTPQELKSTLSQEEYQALSLAYGVSEAGQFEGRSVLHLQEGVDGRVLSEPLIQSALQKLKALRKAKPQPHLDDKIITAWNGWMIWAVLRAGQVLNRADYIDAAVQSMNFIYNNLWAENRLHRYYRDGKKVGPATSEDYASIIFSLIELSQFDSDAKWTRWALELQSKMDTEFWDIEGGLYFLSDGKDSQLPLRSKEEYDGVTPSSNSMAAHNLWRLYLLTGESAYRDKSLSITQGLFAKLQRSPSALAFLALTIDLQTSDPQVLIRSGGGWTEDLKKSLASRFLPATMWLDQKSAWPIAAAKMSKGPAVFVCREGICLEPLESREELEKFLRHS
jgi:uncharacterized protein YyaL (SSP411 family)